MTHRVDDRRGGRNPVPSGAPNRQRLAVLRYRVWQAELIGWPALAESFRRELAALEGQR